MLRSEITRRRLLKSALVAAPGAALASRAPRMMGQVGAAPVKPPRIAPGPFQPTWDSLNAYKTPEWFRDAKFGIWNHWSAQCVPGQGDWYARNMYIQGNRQYEDVYKRQLGFGRGGHGSGSILRAGGGGVCGLSWRPALE